jgi:muconolactone delta-isomerase
LRIWTVPVEPDERRVPGLYRADSRPELDRMLAALPLYDWMQIAVIALVLHPNDRPQPPGPDQFSAAFIWCRLVRRCIS